MKNKKLFSEVESKVNHFMQAKTVAEFLKNKLALQSTPTASHADEIFDNAISRAKIEEKPEWTKFIADTLQADNKQQAQQGNTFVFAASQLTNESLQRLVDVTPKKSKINKIEELI